MIDLRNDDRAVAGVVGFVLVLAAAVTYYSYAAQNEVPRVGAENERAWDADVGEALTRLAQSAGERAGTDAPVREVLRAAPDAPTQTIPFLAPLRSARAAGSLEYAQPCGGMTLQHAVGAASVEDLSASTGGCLSFRGDTVYAEPFRYRYELGGLLRIQGDRAMVLTGPPLDVSDEHVTLTVVELRGPSETLGVDRANAPIELEPRPGALELGAVTNADSFRWEFTTSYPETWRDWYQQTFEAADVTVTTSFTCANPLESGPLRGPCTVLVESPDPTSLSISYGRYEVDLG